MTNAEKHPATEANWAALLAEPTKALAEAPALRKEQADLLAQHAPKIKVTQKAKVTGTGNVTAQSSGEGQINIQR